MAQSLTILCVNVVLIEVISLSSNETYGTFGGEIDSDNIDVQETLPIDVIQDPILNYCDKVRTDNLISTNSHLRDWCKSYNRKKIKYYFNALIINDKIEDILMKYPRNFMHPSGLPQRISGDTTYSAMIGISNVTNFGFLLFKLCKFRNAWCFEQPYIKQQWMELTIILNQEGIEQALSNGRLLSNTSTFYNTESITKLLLNEEIFDDNGHKWYFPAIPCTQIVYRYFGFSCGMIGACICCTFGHIVAWLCSYTLCFFVLCGLILLGIKSAVIWSHIIGHDYSLFFGNST